MARLALELIFSIYGKYISGGYIHFKGRFLSLEWQVTVRHTWLKCFSHNSQPLSMDFHCHIDTCACRYRLDSASGWFNVNTPMVI